MTPPMNLTPDKRGLAGLLPSFILKACAVGATKTTLAENLVYFGTMDREGLTVYNEGKGGKMSLRPRRPSRVGGWPGW
jgi:hypothetical protein